MGYDDDDDGEKGSLNVGYILWYGSSSGDGVCSMLSCVCVWCCIVIGVLCDGDMMMV